MGTLPRKIVVFHCRNLKLFTQNEQKDFLRLWPGVKLVAIPCSGKLEAHHLLKTLASGAEGVVVLACKQSACHYLEGSLRSHKRFDYARSWLDKIGLDPGIIEFRHFTSMDRAGLEDLLHEFLLRLESSHSGGVLLKVSAAGFR